MSKRKQKIDDRQMEFDFVFTEKVDDFIKQKEELLEVMEKGPGEVRTIIDNEFEVSVLVAAGIKRAITGSGLSREQIVDGINEYFGRSKAGAHADEPTCRNPLSIHQFNNYLSKPHSHPIPAYYLFPVHHVTKNLEPLRVIAEPEGAQIATREDVRHMTMGQIEAQMTNLKKMKKQLRDLGGRYGK